MGISDRGHLNTTLNEAKARSFGGGSLQVEIQQVQTAVPGIGSGYLSSRKKPYGWSMGLMGACQGRSRG